MVLPKELLMSSLESLNAGTTYSSCLSHSSFPASSWLAVALATVLWMRRGPRPKATIKRKSI